MRWNLRMAAAQRGIWKASEMHRLLAERGLVISTGKMSGLWSTQPVSIRLDDLEIICAVLKCDVTDLLVREPGAVMAPVPAVGQVQAAAGAGSSVVPQRRDIRSLPPQ